jgi:hypothetical protein
MKTLFLSGALAAALAGGAAAQNDRAVGNLLDAKAAALRGASALQAVFDGAKDDPSSGSAPVAGGSGKVKAAFAAKTAAPAAPQAAAAPAPADVAPSSARGLTDGHLGLYPEDDFELGTGRCSACRGPVQGKWYFLNEVIATPKAGTPAIVWIGSHQMVEGAKLSADGRSVTLKDGTVVAFQTADKIDSNRSFYDASSLEFLRGRALRIRGEFADVGGVRTLVARTIWPEDFRIDPANLGASDAAGADDVDKLVAADKGGATAPFETKLLWEKPGAARDWEGKPVMGFMLNGAQGDDDEALAGHSSLFTGRYGPGGSMADWMFDNFYDMNTVSEKGIIASMVPMDKYMADLNSGQSWYRPSYLLVMVMKDPRVPLQVQEMFKEQYAKYYAQDLKYEHTHMNCTALIADPIRAEGWKFPEKGKTPVLIAKAIYEYILLTNKDKKAAQQVYDSLREEPTRSFPRASFDNVGGDLLSLAGAPGAEDAGRTLTPFEKSLREDLVAVLFVRLPQIPSSRKFGRDPAGSVFQYKDMAPKDPSQWQTVPTSPRPFPPPH